MPLTALQTAQRLGRKTARTALRRPIPRFREGREWRFREDDVDAYIRRHTLELGPRPMTVPDRWQSFADIASNLAPDRESRAIHQAPAGNSGGRRNSAR